MRLALKGLRDAKAVQLLHKVYATLASRTLYPKFGNLTT